MDCSCTVSSDYYNDGCSWGVREVMKARKDHVCCECYKTIKTGSSYFYHNCFGDGTISNHKVCQDCQTVIWQFFSDGWIFGNIWEQLEYYLEDNWHDDLPSSCICKLTPIARNKVCDILQKIHNRQ